MNFYGLQTLKLERPLIILDCETTGPDQNQDKILSLDVTVLHPDHSVFIFPTLMINPGIPIPEEATAVHHITDEMVEHASSFQEHIANVLLRLSAYHGDYCGHNVTFDLSILRAEFKRVGEEWDWEKTDAKILDTLAIARLKNQNTLSATYERYTGKKLDDAHESAADVAATLEVLDGQLRLHTDMPRTVSEIVEWSHPRRPDWIDSEGKFRWKNGEPLVNFGKRYNGVNMRDVHISFWRDFILTKDFSPEIKQIAADAMRGVFPTKAVELPFEDDKSDIPF